MLYYRILLCLFCLHFFSCARLSKNTTTANQNYLPRVDFKARLEPKGQVINGAGQSSDAFHNYAEAMNENTRPVIYMTYVGLKNTDFHNWVAKQKKEMEKYPWLVASQIGFNMTKDGSPEQHYEQLVAAGKYDKQIEPLCLALKEWGIPVYLRIGYEFNGQWNGYEPEIYKKSFINITNALREHQADNVATVWCSSPDANKKDFMSFYPGDIYVDWWSIDIFGKNHFTDLLTNDFLAGALAHKKPVLIGESTPRGVGVQDGEKSWEEWFKPYFDMIHANPHIKAIRYINWNWASYPQWSDWGDERIETNAYVLEQYKKEMRLPLYMHGADAEKTKKKLRMK